jgi:hypothetical protein
MKINQQRSRNLCQRAGSTGQRNDLGGSHVEGEDVFEEPVEGSVDVASGAEDRGPSTMPRCRLAVQAGEREPLQIVQGLIASRWRL